MKSAARDGDRDIVVLCKEWRGVLGPPVARASGLAASCPGSKVDGVLDAMDRTLGARADRIPRRAVTPPSIKE